jgi:Protein of unknown function (DUF3126)
VFVPAIRSTCSPGCWRKKGDWLTRDEIIKLERYLQRVFRLPALQVKQRPRKEDSAEVYIGDEFIGVLYRDDEEGETAYQFQMAILDYDLGG